jgi:chromosomal replication initiation ATPase DnaA
LASQLTLPLTQRTKLTRADFVVAPGNSQAVGFIDAWPDWPGPAGALYGPPGSGKSHLTTVWLEKTGGTVLPVSVLSEIDPGALADRGAVAIENVDMETPSEGRDRALFALLEGPAAAQPLLLTGREPPGRWAVALPDLASRFAALLAFPLWAPDDALLAGLARKLFTDRQLVVPDSVIQRMILSLERSPAAIRDFVARADEKALSENRAVTLGLVRELLASFETEPK